MDISEKNYLTIEEFISIPNLSDINISDDGKNAAFVRRIADWKSNEYRNNIWIYEGDKGQCYELTANNMDSTLPLWSPDSTHIAYLGLVNGVNQIFLRSIDEEGSVQLTSEKEGVSKFKWGSNGKGLYYLAKSKESDEITKRREIYGDYEHIGREYQNNCLYYIEINQNVSKLMVEGNNFDILEFDISNNEDKAAFIAESNLNNEGEGLRYLYIFDINSRELDKIYVNKLIYPSICFSPEGNRICYRASLREKNYYKTRIKDSTLEIYDINSGDVFKPLGDFDSTVTPIRWTYKGILIMWQNRTDYLIGLLSRGGKIDMLCEKRDCCIVEASITEDGNNMAFIKGTAKETFEAYLDNRKLTDENRIFNGKLKSKKELITWRSSDDLEIEGVLSTPEDFDSTKRYPLLVAIHGGPAWAAFPVHTGYFEEKYPIEQFVEKGFIVLEPNYRGSSGYGNEFLKANYRKLGIGDYDDVISGVDALVHKGIADKDRVGVMGWSQGGYISAFCTTCSARFKAVSAGGCISDVKTDYISTTNPQFYRSYLGATPWNDPEIYSKASPMTYIKSACTPTLIQHGENEAEVSAVNSYELYRGLMDMKVDTELVIFKGMGYASINPGINRAIMKQNLIWFSHYILGESLEDLRIL